MLSSVLIIGPFLYLTVRIIAAGTPKAIEVILAIGAVGIGLWILA